MFGSEYHARHAKSIFRFRFSASPEVAPEVSEREAVIGRGQEERAEIFTNVLVEAGSGGKPSLVARKIWNFVPLAGDAIMAYKAFTGVERGKELSKASCRERG